MRLLNVETLKLESYDDSNHRPPYLILSHRWGEDEVLFKDLHAQPNEGEIQDLQRKVQNLEERLESLRCQLTTIDQVSIEVQPATPQLEYLACLADNIAKEEANTTDLGLQYPHLSHLRQKKSGWNKISHCCKEAKDLGLSYTWIDTCCINKESSSELSEAINSMFMWYSNATVCIAYLRDVSFENSVDEFDRSEWFTRGWALQELLAPKDVWFYSNDWQFLGLRSTLASRIALRTLIDPSVLQRSNQSEIHNFSIAARFSWASGRFTTRSEDRVYSLLGLLGANMPIMYGEGEDAAFFRLQVEVYRALPDHSIFAWEHVTHRRGEPSRFLRMGGFPIFARSLDAFRDADSVVSTGRYLSEHHLEAYPVLQYSQYVHGLRVLLLIRPHESGFLQARLGCTRTSSAEILSIILKEEKPGHFTRVSTGLVTVQSHEFEDKTWSLREVFISPNVRAFESQSPYNSLPHVYLQTQLEDRQILNSSFDRIHSLAEVSLVGGILGPTFDSRTNSLFNTLIGGDGHWSSLGDPGVVTKLTSQSPDQSFAYFNKSSRTLFAVVFRRQRFGFVAAVVEPSSTVLDMELVNLEASSKTLKDGWHVSIRASPKDEVLCFYLSVKPPTPLTMTLKRRGENEHEEQLNQEEQKVIGAN